jgi:predicted nucleic acid-binding protein
MGPRGRELVLDASVALSWLFRDEGDPVGDAVATELTTGLAVVPAVWVFELANAVLRGERRGRCTETEAEAWLRDLFQFTIEFDQAAGPVFTAGVLATARRFGLSAYDAAYLELALRRGLPLATLDRRLQEAAAAAGVAAYRPGA